MAKFRNRSTRLLIATDVAARGLDVEDVDIVFNFDLPAKADIYVHRIGRTGRAGKKGLAVSLVTQREKSKIQNIENYSGLTLISKSFPDLAQLKIEELKKNLDQRALMQTLFISGGRKEKVRPGDILGALTGEAGRLNASEIGKIEIHDHFSYVALSKNCMENTLLRLREGRIKGRKFRIELVR